MQDHPVLSDLLKTQFISDEVIDVTKQPLIKKITESKDRNDVLDLTPCLPLLKPTFPENSDLEASFLRRLLTRTLGKHEASAVGALLGLAIGDAFGAPFEFLPLDYKRPPSTQILPTIHFKLKPGQFTDDTSMALCITDSLLINAKFSPSDIMLRFLAWWYFGLNNAFAFDHSRNSPSLRKSIGLGGNIGASFSSFLKNGAIFTTSGDKETNGNGSLMRLSPIAIYSWKRPILASVMAYKHSLITHQGIDAAEACSFMAYILTQMISFNHATSGELPTAKYFLDFLIPIFLKTHSTSKNVLLLAQGTEIAREKGWDWKNPHFNYHKQRAIENNQYIGSYCMDGLAMALHCFYYTTSFLQAIQKSSALGGDADTVSAITGQLAGAYYGVNNIPLDLIHSVERWSNYTISTRAFHLYQLSLA